MTETSYKHATWISVGTSKAYIPSHLCHPTDIACIFYFIVNILQFQFFLWWIGLIAEIRSQNYLAHSFPAFYFQNYTANLHSALAAPCEKVNGTNVKPTCSAAAMYKQIGSIGALLQSSNFITRIVLPLSWSCLFHLFYMVRDYNVRMCCTRYVTNSQPKPNRPGREGRSPCRESELPSTALLAVVESNERERHFQDGTTMIINHYPETINNRRWRRRRRRRRRHVIVVQVKAKTTMNGHANRFFPRRQGCSTIMLAGHDDGCARYPPFRWCRFCSHPPSTWWRRRRSSFSWMEVPFLGSDFLRWLSFCYVGCLRVGGERTRERETI